MSTVPIENTDVVPAAPRSATEDSRTPRTTPRAPREPWGLQPRQKGPAPCPARRRPGIADSRTRYAIPTPAIPTPGDRAPERPGPRRRRIATIYGPTHWTSTLLQLSGALGRALEERRQRNAFVKPRHLRSDGTRTDNEGQHQGEEKQLRTRLHDGRKRTDERSFRPRKERTGERRTPSRPRSFRDR